MTIKNALLVLPCIALAACESTEIARRQAKMEASLSPTVGRSIASIVSVRGAPANMISLSAKQRVYEWSFSSSVPGAMLPVGGMLIYTAPETRQCIVRFTASANQEHAPDLSAWIVQAYSWSGYC